MSDYKLKIKNYPAGITLVEIVVVVFIIALFTVILVSDFPRMLRQMALSRVAYNFAQNLRKAQDLGLSGIQLMDISPTPRSIAVKGYGLYIDLANPKQYIIYADVAGPLVDGVRTSDNKYGLSTYPLCSEVDQTVPIPNFINGGILIADCVVETISLTKEDSSLFIKSFVNGSGSTNASINFSPPGPLTTISNLSTGQNRVGVIFRNSDGGERTVYVNSSGLIDVP